MAAGHRELGVSGGTIFVLACLFLRDILRTISTNRNLGQRFDGPMGAWGVAVFSDDLAADLRGDFRDLIGEGLTASEATERLRQEYSASLTDPDEQSVFWIALACVQWKLGRVEEHTLREALRAIESGADLARWEGRDRVRRAGVLEKVRKQLLSPPPPPKRVPRRIIAANDWSVGEIVGFRLASQKWILLRVIGHHEDKGGRNAVCELLDWVGDTIPPAEDIAKLPIRLRLDSERSTQFLFQEPSKKKDQARVVRLGIVSAPSQSRGGYTALVWPFVDQLLKENFGME